MFDGDIIMSKVGIHDNSTDMMTKYEHELNLVSDHC